MQREFQEKIRELGDNGEAQSIRVACSELKNKIDHMEQAKLELGSDIACYSANINTQSKLVDEDIRRDLDIENLNGLISIDMCISYT